MIAAGVSDDRGLAHIATKATGDLVGGVVADADDRVDSGEMTEVFAHPRGCAGNESVVGRLSHRQCVVADHRRRHAAFEDLKTLEHAGQVRDLRKQPAVVHGEQITELHAHGHRLGEIRIHEIAKVCLGLARREGQSKQTGGLLGRKQAEATLEGHDKGCGHIRWPVQRQLMKHALNARAVRVGHELLNVDAEGHEASRSRDSKSSA